MLRRRCRHRPVQYLNNILEQAHRAIKRRVKAKQGFRAFHAARRTIQGYEVMHMIRKGQARWVSGSDVRRQIQFINNLFEVAGMRRSPADSTNRSLAVFGKLQHIRTYGSSTTYSKYVQAVGLLIFGSRLPAKTGARAEKTVGGVVYVECRRPILLSFVVKDGGERNRHQKTAGCLRVPGVSTASPSASALWPSK